MRIVSGNLWDSGCSIKAVTTNSFVRREGSLVMARGAALQAARNYPDLPLLASGLILRDCGHLGRYDCLCSPNLPVALFQVKRHWKDQADLELIRYATEQLFTFLEANPGLTVAVNYPGIGNGRLSMDLVQPVIEALPDRVHVHLLGNK